MNCIYIIKNTVNNKVYIGQTSRELEVRWNEHKKCGNIGYKLTSKFYRDMYEIGVDNFYIEVLETCNINELDSKEQYYINKYNSFYNGYNSTRGGKQNHNKDTEPEFLANLLLDYGTISGWQLCSKYNISEDYLYKLVSHKNNINKYNNVNTNKPIKVVKYTLDFIPINYYDSLRKALKSIESNYNTTMSGYGRIKAACQNGNIAYGHRWQLLSDLTYDNKTFRTKFDKEAYIQGKPAYQPEGKKYYIVDGALDKVKTLHKNNKCKDCGMVIDKNAIRCLECNEKYTLMGRLGTIHSDIICKQCKKSMPFETKSKLCNSCANVLAKGKLPKPNKEKLIELIDKGMTNKEIAKLYGRNNSTVCIWIKSYGIR